MSLVQVLFVAGLVFCHAQSDKTKRLLLDDIDAVTRLSNLERTVQQLTGDLAQEKLAVSKIQVDLAQEKLAVSTIQVDLAQEKVIVSKLQEKLANEMTKVLQLQQSSTAYGSTYVRWGRKQCSGLHTEMVYTGFAAGNPHYVKNYYSGPANMLCLPNNPELSNRTGTGGSVLYGTEFQDGIFFWKRRC